MLRPATEIHLWSARLDLPAWPTLDRLPPGDRNRATCIRSSRRRRRWVAARWALRGALARYLQRGLAEVELEIGTHGKPELAVSSRSLRFNLSHSGNRALIAIVRGREVGVDVEWIDPSRDVLRLAPRALGPAGSAAVAEAPLARRQAAFHAAWSRREAVAKCLGCGLGTPLPKVAVTVADIAIGAGFAAAVAVEGVEVPRLRCFAIDPADLTPA